MSTVNLEINEDKSVISNIKTTLDEVFEKIRQVDPADSKGDAAIARKLNVSKSTPGQSRAKNTLPYSAIVEYCVHNNVDLNWIFNVDVKLPKNIAADTQQTHDSTLAGTSFSQPEIAKAIYLITKVSDKVGMPKSEIAFEKLLKIYFEYKHTNELEMILEAIAKAETPAIRHSTK